MREEEKNSVVFKIFKRVFETLKKNRRKEQSTHLEMPSGGVERLERKEGKDRVVIEGERVFALSFFFSSSRFKQTNAKTSKRRRRNKLTSVAAASPSMTALRVCTACSGRPCSLLAGVRTVLREMRRKVFERGEGEKNRG